MNNRGHKIVIINYSYTVSFVLRETRDYVTSVMKIEYVYRSVPRYIYVKNKYMS